MRHHDGVLELEGVAELVGEDFQVGSGDRMAVYGGLVAQGASIKDLKLDF